MIERFRKKIILIIEEIINIENPTLEDRKSIIIDKRKLVKAGLNTREINNIVNYLEEKGLVESDSALSRFNEAGLLDDVIKTKDSPKNFNKRYDFVKNTYIALTADFEKLEEYRNKLQSLSSGKEEDNQVNKEVKTKKQNGINYDSKTKILNFKGTKINLSGGPIQADLLITLFKEPEKNWSNDEIYEDWGEEDFKEKTNKFYTAGYEINKAIAVKTTVNDFLILSTKEIRINEKYLDNIIR